MERRKGERRKYFGQNRGTYQFHVPNETKMRLLKIRSDIREVTDTCYVCGQTRPWPEIHNDFNKGACNSCMCYEFGKGE